MNSILIGRVDEFTRFPAEVEIGHDSYFLVKADEDAGYVLLSRFCPHAGGYVHYDGDSRMMFCPSHYWVFEPTGGECETVDGVCLDKVAVTVKDGLLYAQKPEK